MFVTTNPSSAASVKTWKKTNLKDNGKRLANEYDMVA
jgi:hypothetical protein